MKNFFFCLPTSIFFFFVQKLEINTYFTTREHTLFFFLSPDTASDNPSSTVAARRPALDRNKALSSPSRPRVQADAAGRSSLQGAAWRILVTVCCRKSCHSCDVFAVGLHFVSFSSDVRVTLCVFACGKNLRKIMLSAVPFPAQNNNQAKSIEKNIGINKIKSALSLLSNCTTDMR